MPRLTVCPLSVVVFMGTAYLVVDHLKSARQSSKNKEVVGKNQEDGSSDGNRDAKKSPTQPSEHLPPCHVVFVLGGPGAGKGTTCALLEGRLNGGKQWAHLSAGDLLREARNQGGPLGNEINAYISAGQLVPSEVTCKLLETGMERVYKSTGKTRFLIDGFPRSFSNATVWETSMPQHKVAFVLNLECPEEVLLGRLLHRGQTSGRVDDTLDVIRKRFQTNQQETQPILQHFAAMGKVRTIPSDQPIEEVYQQAATLFSGL